MMIKLLLLSSLTAKSLAFVNRPSPSIHLKSSTALAVGIGWMDGAGHETEDDARFVLSQAKKCAYGQEGECSVEEAKELLKEMLHLQSGCAAGTLVGHDICEEQDVAADVVAHLRVKAQATDDDSGSVTTTKE